MGREIVFRGKKRADGEWWYGSYLFLHVAACDWTGQRRGEAEDVHFIVDDQDLNFAVLPETIGQYTGMKDKNGKRIYEGDVMRGTMGDMVVFFGEIIGSGYGFQWRSVSGGGAESMTGFVDEYEVIGNIHDNPDLLGDRVIIHDPDGPGLPAYGMATKRAPKKKTPPKGTKECRYNSGVLCDDQKCDGCGFNPDRKTGEQYGPEN